MTQHDDARPQDQELEQVPRMSRARQKRADAKARAHQRIADQVQAGTLRIRQATEAERKRYGIRGDRSQR